MEDDLKSIFNRGNVSIPIKVKRLHPDAIIPTKAHANDAGFDLTAVEDVIIEPGETVKVPTGIAVELPQGYELQIRPRSGITAKTKLRVQLGTVDSNFRGEVGVIVDNVDQSCEINGIGSMNYVKTIDDLFYYTELFSFPNGTYIIRKGDRIAQAVIQRLPDVELIEVKTLGDSERGAGGFGSTGVKSVG